MKRITLLLLGLVVLLNLTACGDDQDKIVEDITWQKYVSVGQDFYIDLPSDWDVEEQQTAYVKVHSATHDIDFYVMLDRGIGDYTLEEYADMWYSAGADWGDQIYEKISSSEPKIAGSIPAKEYTEESAYEYEGENKQRKGTEVFFVSGGNGYRIYAESPLDEYDTYLPVFNYIINSFRITEVASSKVVWQTLSNYTYGISASFPQDWGVEFYEDSFESTYGNGIVWMYSSGYDATGALVTEETEGRSLDEMNDAALAVFKDAYIKYEGVSENTVNISGLEARETVSIIDDGEGEYKGKAVSFVLDDVYYRASFSAKTDVFKLFEPVWDGIFDSFTLFSDTE
jgi:hypothetical protein